MSLLFLTWLTLAHAGLTANPAPVEGFETALTLTDDEDAPRIGATLRVRYHPGLPDERELGAGITDTRGKVRWTPTTAGPVLVLTGDRVAGAVMVQPASTPLTALVPLGVLLLAGMLSWSYGAGSWPRRSTP